MVETQAKDSRNTYAWRKLQLKRSKLKASAKTSALLAGFAMVAMVEVQFNNDPENPVPPILLIVFGSCTVLLISVHMLALMISTCLLPSIESICLAQDCVEVDPNEAPLEKIDQFIEIAWTFSHVFGIFIFLLEVGILCWCKFWEMGQPVGEPGRKAAIAATLLLIPTLVLFVIFAFHFYRKLVKHNFESQAMKLQELEHIALELKKSTSESKINGSISDSISVIQV